MIANLTGGLFVVGLLGIGVGFLVVIFSEILRAFRSIHLRPSSFQFNLAFILALMVTVGMSLAIRERIPIVLAVVPSLVVCWVTRLFISEVLSGTRYPVDRSLTREGRRQSFPTKIDEVQILNRLYSPEPKPRVGIRHRSPQFTGRIVRLHF
ncbi:MAG: hypothetical protein H6822_34715 [Planctomycetaceae bacterium]|nr:hypothetical protein [Planctomycetales bacterium]MCB9927341.1 hypothetical protein [Planctomycetaceae bacterium]